jgi:protein gp37
MADKSKIEWTDATWNPITGCQIISPGCKNCYAMKLAGTRLKHHPSRAHLTIDTPKGPVWNGLIRFNEEWLDQPRRWRKPRDIFVVAHGDLFYKRVTRAMQARIFCMMDDCRRHRFQVLTKRPETMLDFISECGIDPEDFLTHNRHSTKAYGGTGIIVGSPDHWPMNHVLLGCSVEDQRRADKHRPAMEALAKLGWRVWVSYEPALEPIDWTGWEFLSWMVSGNESGEGARTSPVLCHTSVRDWCAEHAVPYHFKQWGEWLPTSQDNGAISYSRNEAGRLKDGSYAYRVGKKAAGRLLDGVEHNGAPA